MQRPLFLLLALALPLSAACEEEEEPPISDAGPDAASARCTALSCAVDDEVEPAASGDYRAWQFAPGVTVGAIDLSANGRRIVVGDQAGDLHLFTRESGGSPLLSRNRGMRHRRGVIDQTFDTAETLGE